MAQHANSLFLRLTKAFPCLFSGTPRLCETRHGYTLRPTDYLFFLSSLLRPKRDLSNSAVHRKRSQLENSSSFETGLFSVLLPIDSSRRPTGNSGKPVLRSIPSHLAPLSKLLPSLQRWVDHGKLPSANRIPIPTCSVG